MVVGGRRSLHRVVRDRCGSVVDLIAHSRCVYWYEERLRGCLLHHLFAFGCHGSRDELAQGIFVAALLNARTEVLVKRKAEAGPLFFVTAVNTDCAPSNFFKRQR